MHAIQEIFSIGDSVYQPAQKATSTTILSATKHALSAISRNYSYLTLTRPAVSAQTNSTVVKVVSVLLVTILVLLVPMPKPVLLVRQILQSTV